MDTGETEAAPRQKSPRLWQKIAWWHFGIFVTLYLLYGIFCPYYERSYCTKCGAHLSVTFYQIPLTEITLFRRKTFTETPFSRGMQQYHFVEPHAHTWIFAYGRGNTVGCAFNRNEDVYFRVGGEQLDVFMGLLVKYRGRDFAHHWAQRVLTLKHGDKIVNMSIPGDWHISREDFDDLLKDKQFAHDMLLTE